MPLLIMARLDPAAVKRMVWARLADQLSGVTIQWQGEPRPRNATRWVTLHGPELGEPVDGAGRGADVRPMTFRIGVAVSSRTSQNQLALESLAGEVVKAFDRVTLTDFVADGGNGTDHYVDVDDVLWRGHADEGSGRKAKGLAGEVELRGIAQRGSGTSMETYP